MHGTGVILTLFVQVALILALSRLLGWIFSRFHQPQVMGEMIAGILLGPSLLGWAAPEVYQRIFPQESVQILAVLGQIGAVLFLFLIGLELDPANLRSSSKSTKAIALATTVCPFLLGVLFGILFYKPHSDWRSAMFIGVAMSITAFPLLARILTQRNLHRSQVGVVTIAVAGTTNLAVWCILGAVLATQKLQAAISGAAFMAVLILIIRPFLRRVQLIFEQRGRLNQNMLALIIFLLCVIPTSPTL